MTDIKLKQTDIKNFTKYLDDLINIGKLILIQFC